MKKMLLFIGITLIGLILTSCANKEDLDVPIDYNITYRLQGKYFRDSAITGNGYKMLELREDGNYCWVRRAAGKDSLYCYGTYVQTSDTSMLWNGTDLVTFKVTPIDSIASGMSLQIFGSPPVPLLYGFFR